MSSDGSYNSYNDDEWDGKTEVPEVNSSFELVRYVKLPMDRYDEVRSHLLSSLFWTVNITIALAIVCSKVVKWKGYQTIY